jgi:peptidoglycan/xylan/chitin deacetylase (PgdA/CDA1 family)
MLKLLSFRFDIDTHKCIKQGVPNLLKLAKKHDVHFTFFVNMGRAIARDIYLLDIFKRKPKTTLKKLSNLKKLGIIDYIITALQNPLIGKNHPRLLRYIYQEGHELGLHGGTNHGLWQKRSSSWQRPRLEKEVGWGQSELMSLIKAKPLGFASPGWKGSEKLNNILKKLEFRYVADTFSLNSKKTITYTKNRLTKVTTNICGRDGVGYIEYMRAIGSSNEKILADFKNHLRSTSRAIIFDHPYYSGAQEIALLREMIQLAKKEGFKIVPINEMVSSTA